MAGLEGGPESQQPSCVLPPGQCAPCPHTAPSRRAAKAKRINSVRRVPHSRGGSGYGGWAQGWAPPWGGALGPAGGLCCVGGTPDRAARRDRATAARGPQGSSTAEQPPEPHLVAIHVSASVLRAAWGCSTYQPCPPPDLAASQCPSSTRPMFTGGPSPGAHAPQVTGRTSCGQTQAPHMRSPRAAPRSRVAPPRRPQRLPPLSSRGLAQGPSRPGVGQPPGPCCTCQRLRHRRGHHHSHPPPSTPGLPAPSDLHHQTPRPPPSIPRPPPSRTPASTVRLPGGLKRASAGWTGCRDPMAPSWG